MSFDAASPPRVVFLVGSGKGPGKGLLHKLIGLHPSCSLCPLLDDSIVGNLATLSRFPAGNATDDFPRFARTRERILRAGFGDSILRFAGSLSGKKPVTLLSASTPKGVDLFFEFFPMVPLVIVDDAPEPSVEIEAFYDRNKHYPVLVVRPEDLKTDLPRTLARIFELAGLNRDTYPWREAEKARAPRGLKSAGR